MKKFLYTLRNTCIAGLIFLLPLLILFVLLAKVFQLLTGISSKIAALFGLSSIPGGSTIVSAVGIIILCIASGYLVRISFFKRIRNRMDDKLAAYIPGYSAYRDTAVSKLKGKGELPYQSAALATLNGVQQPCFVIEILPDGRHVVFFPAAGNAKQGLVVLLSAEKLQLLQHADMHSFSAAINKLGSGIGNQIAAQT